ncbi:P-loop ATPase, Sll1717 family [Pseudomonas mangiferae]|uniref:KAP NTPase domain-containing protein n=1 Tax=Pseudomonas mangiferae TaxID=2593654 RepID=A0A553H0R8_9PSED|nr:hypothetical protein [Pseudomonas mangiferae]TRX75345.1 hypothetical protein FM069_06255 [Pseudomonas mangiferae]
MNINQISWGDDSAEKDAYLLEYFVTSESLKRLAEKEKGIVIGRKGSGKSALLKKLDQIFRDQDETTVIKVAPKYNSIRTILNNKDISSNFGTEIFFQHTWLRQIYLDLMCNIGHGAKGVYASGSYEVAREIAKQQGRTSKDIVENIADVLAKVKAKVGDLGEFGLELEKELRNIADVEALEHHINALISNKEKAVVLIDDLDLGWDNSETANDMLLGLLSAANYIGGMNNNIHPVIFLREDVYSILMERTQHSDKYRNVERLRWSKGDLVAILESRINFNRTRDGLDAVPNPFLTVFPQTVGVSHTDNWMIERTLSRPRELIQLSRYYSEGVDGDLPSDAVLKASESEYSNWKLDDLCAEYSNQYPGLGSVFSYWKTRYRRHKYHLKKAELEEILLGIMGEVTLNQDWFSKLVDQVNVDGLMAILYEIGFLGDFVLGGQGGSKTYYSYESRHEPVFDEVQIHSCFRKAVNTVERIRSL